MAYSSDLTDAQWKALEPVLLVSPKRGPKHGADLRHVVNAMLYISHTGCQGRFLPEEFGPWTRVWSPFRRWSRNGTSTRALTALHASSRTALGRREPRPSMVVIDTHLARGDSNGGATCHNQGAPYGRTNGAKRIVCVDVTGRALCVRVVPASTSEASAVEQTLDDLNLATRIYSCGSCGLVIDRDLNAAINLARWQSTEPSAVTQLVPTSAALLSTV